MLRAVMLGRVCGLALKANINGTLRNSTSFSVQKWPCRSLSQIFRNGIIGNDDLPEAPPLSVEDLDFIDDLVDQDNNKTLHKNRIDPSAEINTPLPKAPPITSEWEDIVKEAENEDEAEEYEDIEAVPYIPPLQKTIMIAGDTTQARRLFLTASGSDELSGTVERESHLIENQSNQPGEDIMLDPRMEEAIAAWARAVVPTPATGPMPLHELANRSKKIKQLVKLGVDFSKIVKRHGDLERLLQLDWEAQLKPQIQFLVDVGIDPQNLGTFFTVNTPLIWTDKDDIQVRINYLEAKQFTKEEISKILNRAPNWLTLPTKELDSRLGFIQKAFQLKGSEIREVVCSSPKMVSFGNKAWAVVVDSVKLMDRELGFNHWERKELLMKRGSCYTKPDTVREAFNYCHNQIGLSHTQLVKHAGILLCRVSRIKPRYEFLKFLKRDIFDCADPLYTSPDWLFKGTIEEFCVQAAKCTFNDYETFLKYS
ncbi:transcription termination factor 3, mitochondrial [Thrips palmi]|uniref:Transcription termination factor 3, mitochondrial n=1 Tax=Thrips palmi TaxID=161013 RepID=A0A6P9A446_THRPL|nr:transcription termination factor 3, mitochondrial [Thrips palmi]